ncbi:MAG: fibronectin type III domain-containing protein, partial [Acidobacteria bacterium]|nr:fibronectin type III domain-containing protein [Acidobacteriota bacterium]
MEATSSTTPTRYEFDIATEADYEYVQALGGSENANREIRGILNQVEGVYQSELSLQLRISFQHTWDTQHDPYTTRNALGLLNEFRNHWNRTSKANENYDLAHLWTGRRTTFALGIAWHGTVCRDRSSSYSLSGYFARIRLPRRYSLAAHEIAHNFGATHPEEQNPPVSSCNDSIMFGTGLDLTFCDFSRQEIGTYLANNNHCLTRLPITLQPPTGLRAIRTSNSRIDLTWRDNSDNETGFLLQQRRHPDYLAGWVVPWISIATVPANVSTFSVDGLLPGTSYRYRVRAFNDIESSVFSNAVRTATLGIQAPTGLVAARRSNTWIYLVWEDNSDNETGFRLYRRLHGSPDWVPIATIAANVTRFTDRGLLSGTHYDYLLQAFNSTETSNFSNEYVTQTRGSQHLTAPGLKPPTKLTATATSNSQIELTWQDNSSDEMKFRVQVRLDGSPDWEPVGETYTDVTGIGIGGLTPGTSYHFRVRAINDGNDSPFSNEVKVTTLEIGIQPPTGLIATVVSSSGVQLTWQDNSDNETGFLLQRRLDGSPDWVSITITLPNATLFGDAGLIPGASYHYRVRAFNGTESSNFSNEVGAPRFHNRLFVPIVLRSQGRTPGSFFTSELTLTNRGTTTAAVNYTYKADFGGGSGLAVDYLDPGRQRVIPDAIAYLT